MNDFNDSNDIIGDAIRHRSNNAPESRPDFGDVLADRQQRLRRRSAIGAVGVLAIGVTGMAAFAVGGPTQSTADGPIGSGGGFVTTTAPGTPVESPMPGETVWYCEGALDNYAGPAPAPATTTTIAPETTIMVPVESELVPEATYVPPLVDSGYFRDCVLVTSGEVAPSQEDVPETTTTSLAPTDEAAPVPTTIELGSRSYVVQSGDFPLKVADQFCVQVDDLQNFNNWTTINEFPFPGAEIQIPPGGCTFSPPDPCPTPGCDAVAVHTVEAGDFLIKIANDYCVAVDDFIALNGWESGADDFPFVGEEILIPAPPTSGPCPDNGPS